VSKFFGNLETREKVMPVIYTKDELKERILNDLDFSDDERKTVAMGRFHFHSHKNFPQYKEIVDWRPFTGKVRD